MITHLVFIAPTLHVNYICLAILIGYLLYKTSGYLYNGICDIKHTYTHARTHTRPPNSKTPKTPTYTSNHIHARTHLHTQTTKNPQQKQNINPKTNNTNHTRTNKQTNNKNEEKTTNKQKHINNKKKQQINYIYIFLKTPNNNNLQQQL